jgi:hypothetical protein
MKAFRAIVKKADARTPRGELCGLITINLEPIHRERQLHLHATLR